jgi:hypothetical protein
MAALVSANVALFFGWRAEVTGEIENQRFFRSCVNRITRKGKKTAETAAK